MRSSPFFLPFLTIFLRFRERSSLLDKGMVYMKYMKQKIPTKKEGTEIVRGTDA